jgi:hypothetical protein
MSVTAGGERPADIGVDQGIGQGQPVGHGASAWRSAFKGQKADAEPAVSGGAHPIHRSGHASTTRERPEAAAAMSVSRAASLNQPNYVLRALRAPSIVPSIQLSPAEAAHMSDPRAETAEPDCALKSCPTVE